MLLKNCAIFLIAMSLMTGCNSEETDNSETQVSSSEQNYYQPLYKVLEAHGGIEQWNQYHTLSFELQDSGAANQVHTVNLYSRDTKIEAPNFSMGSKGGDVWLKQDSSYFEGSPRFFHSLMFYFHTMPFVFADSGINYEKVDDKEIKGKTYEGIKMSFDEHVGDAPKDQYILYYDPESYQMEWLAYNSTYSSQKKSDQFNMIHYKQWEETNGFQLPTVLQWHEYKNGKVGAPQSKQVFVNTSLAKDKMSSTYYNIPEQAMVDSAAKN